MDGWMAVKVCDKSRNSTSDGDRHVVAVLLLCSAVYCTILYCEIWTLVSFHQPRSRLSTSTTRFADVLPVG